MKCPACSAEVVKSVYCHKCGARLDDPEGTSEGGPADAGGSNPGPQLADRLRQGNGAQQDVPEEELWEGTYNVKAMAGAWLVSLLVTMGLIIAGILIAKPVVWWIVLGLILALWLYQVVILASRRLGVRYRLTTHRFFHEAGILIHTTDLIEVIDMDDITYRQTLIDRMTGVGSINIISSDRSHPDLRINGIENVRDVAAMMHDARHAERIRRGLHIERI
ncbi:MAG: PH domain-containing protein [Pirellulales bacterium]|nr:PH domain-containing protein [Pirellulales bacterium]